MDIMFFHIYDYITFAYSYGESDKIKTTISRSRIIGHSNNSIEMTMFSGDVALNLNRFCSAVIDVEFLSILSVEALKNVVKLTKFNSLSIQR